jgi:hypothetical protein
MKAIALLIVKKDDSALTETAFTADERLIAEQCGVRVTYVPNGRG